MQSEYLALIFVEIGDLSACTHVREKTKEDALICAVQDCALNWSRHADLNGKELHVDIYDITGMDEHSINHITALLRDGHVTGMDEHSVNYTTALLRDGEEIPPETVKVLLPKLKGKMNRYMGVHMASIEKACEKAYAQ
tara:strand:+ start:26 stop:442 length:417 start_codon:yes stop_codon:yes gene_type:complete